MACYLVTSVVTTFDWDFLIFSGQRYTLVRQTFPGHRNQYLGLLIGSSSIIIIGKEAVFPTGISDWSLPATTIVVVVAYIERRSSHCNHLWIWIVRISSLVSFARWDWLYCETGIEKYWLLDRFLWDIEQLVHLQCSFCTADLVNDGIALKKIWL